MRVKQEVIAAKRPGLGPDKKQNAAGKRPLKTVLL